MRLTTAQLIQIWYLEYRQPGITRTLWDSTTGTLNPALPLIYDHFRTVQTVCTK